MTTQIGNYLVEQVPIEQIQHGDTVLHHLPDGSHRAFVVEARNIAGGPGGANGTIALLPTLDSDPPIEGPPGTLVDRVVGTI